jgi:hypothetical protein
MPGTIMWTSQRLVDLIETHADELANRWLTTVKEHPGTPTYANYNDTLMYDRAFDVYKNLSKWIMADSDKKDEIRRKYMTLGAQRYREGIPLSEVLMALLITRRVLWSKVESEGMLDTAVEVNMAMAMSNQVQLFFERALVFVARGYEQAAAEGD